MQLISLIATLPLFLSGAYASPFGPIEKRLAPAGTSCGVVGYDRGHFILNKRQCSLSECATLCAKNSQCRSYGYGENTCRLYSSLVKDNVDCQKRSPYIFYDKACKAPIGPKITTTSTVSTTTTALACPSNKPFAILSLKNTASADGTPDIGTPATLPQEDITNGPRTGPDYLLFSTSSGLATFTLDSSCHLVSSKSDRPATIFTNDPGLQRVSFDANVGVPGVVPGVCAIFTYGNGLSVLTCTFGDRVDSQNDFGVDSQYQLTVGEGNDAAPAASIALQVSFAN
ncbi:unnamed protein product [Zymoseptoria tritici ST99CH_1A5]|uniref:Apple domain-containing protein n=1 Tax=Zymoseptoria tritici ST99CH_1A5 TaxID=1276529 RepID=A0A1Y6L8C9_ZYMTR|nr:unnamed protein product [Zymoseptoria tritici ST99CH_1A5]